MALSDMAIKKAKPREKIYTLKDADGLYLEIKPSGKKYWRLRYWIDSKENRLSLGEYPLISLAEARSRRDDKRRMIKDGVDTFIEIGVGKTLTGLIKRIDNSVKAFKVETPADFEALDL